MSLYYDAAQVLSASPREGSLKSRIYGNKLNLKSKPANIYALISETAKYDFFLKEVVENADILSHEAKLTPLLSILLAHDHFFAKGGIAAPATHPLRQSIERHKARLQSEFTKLRLKRRCQTIESLREKLLSESSGRGGLNRVEPRWVRVNTLKSTVEEQMNTTFRGYQTSGVLSEISNAQKSARILYLDPTIPNLLGLPPELNLTQSDAYKHGEIILQDKASCFPAHLLLGDSQNIHQSIGDLIDGCAAPGNKTTHAAAILSTRRPEAPSRTSTQVFACERDAMRSKILENMVQKAGASTVNVLPRQDFLALNPKDPRFSRVTHLLLDPSCSGSGIIGRQDMPVLALPDAPKAKTSKPVLNGHPKSKKRKREDTAHQEDANETLVDGDDLLEQGNESITDSSRLQKLANLQSKIVEHAFQFPAATHVTYSTCSVHFEENEGVVQRVLDSSIAKARGWRILKREEQVKGLRDWKHRGVGRKHSPPGQEATSEHPLDKPHNNVLEACIRCTLGDQEGTMGFFVCGFVRDPDREEHSIVDDGSDEWEGFSDG